ncbi:hypothetical protein KR084_012342, partial [Drosophila pseudotakahashii]
MFRQCRYTRYSIKMPSYSLFIKGASLCVYGICCFFDLGSFRYVKDKGKLRRHHTCWQWIVLAVCIKFAILCLEIPFILISCSLIYYFLMGDFLNLAENSIYYWVHLVSQMVMSTISTMRLVLLTHSSSYNTFIISLVNRVIRLNRIVRRSFGKNLHPDKLLVLIFLLKVSLTLHHIVAQYTPHGKVLIRVRFPTVNVILFELFYCSYFLYQLILLSWQQTLNAYVKVYTKYVKVRRCGSSAFHRKLIKVFDIYTEVGDIHFQVSSAWLKVSSMLFSNIYYTAHESTYTLYCLFAASKATMIDRVYLVILKKLGSCFHPLFAVLLMGIASDRLQHLEAQLSTNIFLVELLY